MIKNFFKSIDWGEFFERPLLTPYEAIVSLDQVKWQPEYPMDYYSYESLGNWTVNEKTNRTNNTIRPVREKIKIEYESNK